MESGINKKLSIPHFNTLHPYSTLFHTQYYIIVVFLVDLLPHPLISLRGSDDGSLGTNYTIP